MVIHITICGFPATSFGSKTHHGVPTACTSDQDVVEYLFVHSLLVIQVTTKECVR